MTKLQISLFVVFCLTIGLALITVFSFILADIIKKIDNPPMDKALQDTLTVQDIAWFCMNPDKTCWRHLSNPCRNCGFRQEDYLKSLTASDNIVIGKTAHLAAIERKKQQEEKVTKD